MHLEINLTILPPSCKHKCGTPTTSSTVSRCPGGTSLAIARFSMHFACQLHPVPYFFHLSHMMNQHATSNQLLETRSWGHMNHNPSSKPTDDKEEQKNGNVFCGYFLHIFFTFLLLFGRALFFNFLYI